MPARLVVGMVGAECTGKTRLAQDLASALDAHYVGEELRTWVTVHGRTPLVHEQHEILIRQHTALAAACTQDPDRAIIVDTAPLMTAAYSQAYFEDDSLWESAVDATSPCTHLVWCQPDFPWIPEPGMRDGASWRTAVDQIVRARSGELSTHWPVITAHGAPGERLNHVLSALRGSS